MKSFYMSFLFPISWIIYCIMVFLRYPERVTLLNIFAMIIGIVMLYFAGFLAIIILKKRRKAPSAYYLLAISLTIMVIDQLTKELIIRNLSIGDKIEILRGFLAISHTLNTNHNVLFSLLGNSFFSPLGNILFKLFSLITFITIVTYCIYFRGKYSDENGSMALGITLTLTASISSIIDTVFRGYVVDYFSLSTLVSFDLKDIVMLIGIGIILYSYFVWRPIKRSNIAKRNHCLRNC